MVTYNQQIEAEGTTFRASGSKRGLLGGRKPLVILFLFGLALSVVFPYGLGIAVLAWVIALVGAVMGVGYASYLLLKELLGKTATFGYAPTAAYLAGKKTKKTRKAGSTDEEEKNDH
ncbi:MAG TPA: hypothetical protein VN604_00215 [Nitrospirota bacterium]|nr:hypothetical protein [Nitrospirota bacterium]